tara:strand:- start:139 stop:426 length:288 start_codon:yes stop_codon:yes gene_type:complete
MNQKKKKSIRNARTVGKKKYTKLIHKKKTKKRLTRKEKRQLDHALFINYCKCIKKLKYSKDYEKGIEYPICISSVYKKRGFRPPKDIQKKCKKYF